MTVFLRVPADVDVRALHPVLVHLQALQLQLLVWH